MNGCHLFLHLKIISLNLLGRSNFEVIAQIDRLDVLFRSYCLYEV